MKKYLPGDKVQTPKGNIEYVNDSIRADNKSCKIYGNWKCHCGHIFECNIYSVAYGDTKSCGCLSGKFYPGFLFKNKFGVIEFIKISDKKSKKGHNVYGWWKCHCGKEFETKNNDIVSGRTKSCKCLVKSKLKDSRISYLRSAFNAIKGRCLNPNNPRYPTYGGRGIKIQENWLNDSNNFVGDILDILGHRPSKDYSLDRIDINGDYTMSNLKWSLNKEQARNKTTSVLICILGQEKTLSEWAEISNIKATTIRKRYNAGWPEERLLTKPAIKEGNSQNLYYTWKGVIQRCYNPNNAYYLYYGARGIKLFPDWKNSYDKFYLDIIEEIGPKPSSKHQLDRYPNKNGNYEPGNIRWATPKENNNNKRNNITIFIDGKEEKISDLSVKYNLPKQILAQRIRDGFDLSQLFQPVCIRKFTEEEAENIRKEFKTVPNKTKLAIKYNVTKSVIKDIIYYRGAYERKEK